MKSSLNRPAPGIIGVVLAIAFILFGVLVGMSVMVLSQAVAGERLLGLWGPAIGACIGASATVGTALYTHQRAERRALRSAIRGAERQIAQAFALVGMVGPELEIAARAHYYGQPSQTRNALKRIDDAIGFLARLELADEIPLAVVSEVNSAKTGTVGRLFEALDRTKAADALAAPNGVSEWGQARTAIERAANELRRVYGWLRDWTE